MPATPEMFQYDLDGNLTNDGRWSYWWDGENRLTNMVANSTKGPQLNIRFEYDWQGRRIAKKVWSNIAASGSPVLDEKYVYDGWNLIAILNPDLSPRTSFMWGTDLSGSMQGAGGVGGLLAVYDRANGVHFTTFDGNGNVSALVSAATGEPSAQYEYGPFGELLRAKGPMARANPFRFSTKYQDDETDLLYYGFRYYNASTGRWLSRDPIGEAGFRALTKTTRKAKKHLLEYGFVANSPTTYWDYLGLDNPGCDLPGWLVPEWNRDCFLRCCALHDMCYYQQRDFGGKPCNAKSWLNLLNPCSRCGQCNRDVVGCFLGCLLGGPSPGPMWFCSNGPSAGTMYYNWDSIPASCWEDGVKPEGP